MLKKKYAVFVTLYVKKSSTAPDGWALSRRWKKWEYISPYLIKIIIDYLADRNILMGQTRELRISCYLLQWTDGTGDASRCFLW